jgi:diaminopimelate decarboxylase
LLLEVTEVEPRGERVFVGLNGGFNLHPEPVFYDLPLEPLPIVRRSGRRRRVTLAGNINEAHDLWARDTLLPPLAEGDVVALLNAGGYGASMASNHCMRGEFSELMLS